MTASTEVDLRPQAQASAMPAKIAYAKALADSGLLPASYRKNPANVLWAVEYGDMLGLSTMAAITGVHVIDGKPGASAGLISALVRRAGHNLRVTGDNKSATCVITRCDDPKHPFTVTWTLRTQPGDNPSAELAGLLSKPVWKQYPAAMLKARAITQCARDACEEALFGLHYTPEELGANVDEDGVVIAEVVEEPDQDDTCSWYDRAKDEADSLTTEAAGGELWREAAATAKAGDCTPDQATHVQNKIRTRLKQLKDAATPVDVEDLARAAQDAAAEATDA